MLSKIQMVKRQAIESLYDGTCTITGVKEITDDDGATDFEQVVICENQPCRLSFGSSRTQENGTATGISQAITLFLSPDINVPTGSRITVTQNGRTTEYDLSSPPEVYSSHQQINLSMKERWS